MLYAGLRRSRHELWRPQLLSPTWLNNFPFPSAASLTLLSSHSGWPEQAGADFLILLGVESHIVQRWAANLATTLTLAVRIAEQGTL
jgi:hypothetical protein